MLHRRIYIYRISRSSKCKLNIVVLSNMTFTGNGIAIVTATSEIWFCYKRPLRCVNIAVHSIFKPVAQLNPSADYFSPMLCVVPYRTIKKIDIRLLPLTLSISLYLSLCITHPLLLPLSFVDGYLEASSWGFIWKTEMTQERIWFIFHCSFSAYRKLTFSFISRLLFTTYPLGSSSRTSFPSAFYASLFRFSYSFFGHSIHVNWGGSRLRPLPKHVLDRGCFLLLCWYFVDDWFQAERGKYHQ